MLMKFLKRIGKDEVGGTAIEYSLIASLVVLVAMGGITAFADATTGLWDRVGNDVNGAIGG